MRVYAAVILVIVSLASPLRADSLDPKQVSADAKWVVQVDVDAMRSSTVVQRVYAQVVPKWKDLENRTAAIRQQMCMDPNKDLHGVTAYGPKPGQTEGVMIVQAAVDQQQFIDKVSKALGYRMVQYGPRKLNAWTQADGPVTSAFFGKNVILLAKTDADVKAALDVLDGKAPSLFGKPSSLAASSPAGTILLVRAIGLSAVDLPFRSPLVKQSESVDITFGEDRGKSFSSATLVTNPPKSPGRSRRLSKGFARPPNSNSVPIPGRSR